MNALTTNWTTAMHRLADHLGYTLESSGGSWTITAPVASEEFGPVKGSARWLLAHMTTVALSTAGMGMDPRDVRDIIRLRLPQDPKRAGATIWPTRATATEQAALARVITFEGVDMA